jgi:fructokinase
VSNSEDLTLHVAGRSDAPSAVVVGEVLWDVFPESVRLGGAPLNFSAHLRRLGFNPILLSAVGRDRFGERAAREIAALGLGTAMLHRSEKWETGSASVAVDSSGQPAFRIARPAAYDDLRLTEAELGALQALAPSWFYYGTLFPSTPEGRSTLGQLLKAMPGATRFYDVNLRPGFESLELVTELLAQAGVVKLNEAEAQTVARHLSLPEDDEGFCRAGAARFGWRAVCITLGERGCAVFDGAEFVRAGGERVQVADTVGAGDAFAAAFVHGLEHGWPALRIARFANRVGALVASRAGAIPEWNLAEAAP